MSRYANIIVDISMEKLDKTFQYRIPDKLKEELAVGTQVIVPFGSRTLTGYVLELTDICEFEPSKMTADCPGQMDAPDLRRNHEPGFKDRASGSEEGSGKDKKASGTKDFFGGCPGISGAL